MKKASFLSLAVFLAVTSIQTIKAQVFSENFGSLANGTTITTANTSLSYARVSTGAGASFLYATNDQFSGASALMSAGTSSLTGIGKSGLTAFTTGTLSFSLYSSATLNTFAFFLGTGTTFTGNSTFAGADLTAGFQFVSGQLQSRVGSVWNNVGSVGFAGGTAYNFSIVFNDSASTVAYGSGSDTVATKKADIWINGILVDNEVAIDGLQTVTGLRMYTTSTGSPIEVDNIQLFNTVPAPEPSTMALATLGGIACFFVARRKR